MAPWWQRLPGPGNLARYGWMLLQEAVEGFIDNGDLRQASSLAFYTTLALIPAILLLTLLLALVTGSSLAAHQRLTDYLAQMVPGEAERVLEEVASVTRHPKAVGLLNILILLWSVTPLVSSLREIIRGIFKERETRSIWITKLLDVAAGMGALLGLAAIAGAGVLFHFVNASLAQLPGAPVSLGLALPFGVTTVLVTAILHMSAPRGVRLPHLFAGALATAALWFLLRPAFTLFLTYDRNYGLAFGSFKSLFLIVIWIYVSMAVLLLGAEMAAACHRGEAVAIRRLMQGKWSPWSGGRFVLEVRQGDVFFREGETGDEMYYLLSGSVAIRKGSVDLARIGPGRFFGEMTFLLGQDRSATAVALEPTRCVVVRPDNFNQLLRENPGTARAMLVEMASRLRDTGERAGGIWGCVEPDVQSGFAAILARSEA